MTDTSKSDARDALSRVYRAYFNFCMTPDRDSVFTLLSALHSLHDRCPTETRDFLFSRSEFVSLKALRNYFQHEAEVRHRLKVVPANKYPIITDLFILCLVDRAVVDAALDAIPEKRRTVERAQAEQCFKWYGPCVNINPAILNLIAALTLHVMESGLVPDEPAYAEMAQRIAWEEAHGHEHFVTGDIACHAGNVDAVFTEILAKDE